MTHLFFLRTCANPLLGILGAAEFLADTSTDAYQSGLVTSIVTCGKTLLDTLNHVLDYSKINKLGKAAMRKRAKANKSVNLASDSHGESLNLTADVDLGILVEEVAEAVTAGHRVTQNNTLPDSATMAIARPSITAVQPSNQSANPENPSTSPNSVAVLLDIAPRRSWIVRIQPGALRRIIMNLLGNALKYTTTGFVAVSLRAQETSNNGKINALIRVVDSGRGMSDAFMRDKMFVPFSQEDPFQPGTGLGLSIVKQIVDSLGGSIEVHSEVGIGTEIDIHLSLIPAQAVAPNSHAIMDEDMRVVAENLKGKLLVILDPTDPDKRRPPTHRAARFHQTISEICSCWFGMQVSRSSDMDQENAAVYLYCEPPSVEVLAERHHRKGHPQHHRRVVPVVVVCQNDQDAMSLTRDRDRRNVLHEIGGVVEVISLPCGPRKLAKTFLFCLNRAAEIGQEPRDVMDTAKDQTEATQHELTSIKEGLPPRSVEQELRSSVSAALSYPAPPPLDPETPSLAIVEPPEGPLATKKSSLLGPTPGTVNVETPKLHLLLVDDNKINRQLLVMFMKKCGFSYLEAENGQEAVDLYIASCPTTSQEHILDSGPSTPPSLLDSRATSASTIPVTGLLPRPFDVILMDISMPVMDGMEATKRIRDFEKAGDLKRTTVIALTGLASERAREEAETVGVDVFLPKPVKFAELRTLLDGERK